MKKRIFSAQHWDNVYKDKNWDNVKHNKDVEVFKSYLKKGDRVLDVGCGKGGDIAYLAESGFDSYGLDISNVAISKIRKLFPYENLHLCVGKAEKLPFEENFFKGVYCNRVLYHVNIKKTLLEIHRVLKKSGVAYIGVLLDRKFNEKKKLVTAVNELKLMNYIKDFKVLKREEYRTSPQGKPYENRLLVLVLKK